MKLDPEVRAFRSIMRALRTLSFEQRAFVLWKVANRNEGLYVFPRLVEETGRSRVTSPEKLIRDVVRASRKRKGKRKR